MNISNLMSGISNIIIAYIAMMLTRLVYAMENWTEFRSVITNDRLLDLISGSLTFDTSTVFYLNATYLLVLLFPCHVKEVKIYYTFTRWTWFIPNALGVCMNLIDASYFRFTGRRTTTTVFCEFSNEENLFRIFGVEILRHWYLVLIGIIILWGMFHAFRRPVELNNHKRKTLIQYYSVQTISLILATILVIGGIRGGFTTTVRPITISNANQYVSTPTGAALVLTTPFSIIRTLGKATFQNPNYYTQEQLNTLFSPIHNATQDTTSFIPKNVVVLICESLGQEYFRFYNKNLESGKYKGYTPFLDSLCSQSLTFRWNFANGRKSIDGMPSILSSIPMFVEPFFLTSYSMNNVSGLASELSTKGYQTAFFHGAQNGSMGFQAFSRASGFQSYYGRTEFDNDPEFGSDKEFDGTWAIWDEPFLQFYAKKMSEMHQPFMTAVFTASSHHPYNIPEKYKKKFPEGSLLIHKCVRYLDYSLRRFFDKASHEPWYKNTIFVITGDHTNATCMSGYQTDWGLYAVPVIFYDPSHTLIPSAHRNATAQQIDIMPTVLSVLHYDKPYVGFGIDLINTPDSLTWAVNYNNGIYQYFQAGLFLQFDGNKVTHFYKLHSLQKSEDITNDSDYRTEKGNYLTHLKAIIQSYMERMTTNKLKIER